MDGRKLWGRIHEEGDRIRQVSERGEDGGGVGRDLRVHLLCACMRACARVRPSTREHLSCFAVCIVFFLLLSLPCSQAG
jgi:hypothetical protein